MSIREIIKTLKHIYCECTSLHLHLLYNQVSGGTVGIQYVHIPDKEQCDWICKCIEVPKPYTLEEKRMILDHFMWSESFKIFIASKYPNEKHFGLEGYESLIPGMKALINHSMDHGIKHVTIGMPHHDCLNVLANVSQKPIEAILNKFSSGGDLDNFPAGNVKYHLGTNYVHSTPSGKKVSLSLVTNPSHLGACNPVVLGKTCVIQNLEKNKVAHTTAMGVLLYSDATFAGQGIVYETMGFHNLPYYGTGITIHLIVNNQIGFTTDPCFA